jgi:hypothetical protein
MVLGVRSGIFRALLVFRRSDHLTMRLSVMPKAKPSNVQIFSVVVVMSFCFFIAANFARQPNQPSISDCITNCRSCGCLSGLVLAAALLICELRGPALWSHVSGSLVGQNICSAFWCSVSRGYVFFGASLAFIQMAVCHLCVQIKQIELFRCTTLEACLFHRATVPKN